jgi:preprotein translocase subunit YajC
MALLGTVALIAQAAPQQDPGAFLKMMGPMLIIMVAFMVITSMSNKKRARQHEDLLKSLKPGDKVLTSGGIIGTVVTVKDKSLSLRSSDTKLEILKSAISEVTERSGAAESKES